MIYPSIKNLLKIPLKYGPGISQSFHVRLSSQWLWQAVKAGLAISAARNCADLAVGAQGTPPFIAHNLVKAD